MLKIRLSRTGKKHEPHYRVVVTEARSKRDGKVKDQLGHWHPKSQSLIFDKDSYAKWLKHGAKPSATVRRLASKI